MRTSRIMHSSGNFLWGIDVDFIVRGQIKFFGSCLKKKGHISDGLLPSLHSPWAGQWCETIRTQKQDTKSKIKNKKVPSGCRNVCPPTSIICSRVPTRSVLFSPRPLSPCSSPYWDFTCISLVKCDQATLSVKCFAILWCFLHLHVTYLLQIHLLLLVSNGIFTIWVFY